VKLLLLALTCLAGDQLVKGWVQRALLPGESWPVVSGVFHLTRVHNPGAAFSLLQDYPQLLLWITALAFGAFLAYCLKRHQEDWLAGALLLGGAAGNLLDRLQYGYVVDYFDFRLIHYPVFNLADVCIVAGVGLLLLRYAGFRLSYQR
jgi:signal peptidase II